MESPACGDGAGAGPAPASAETWTGSSGYMISIIQPSQQRTHRHRSRLPSRPFDERRDRSKHVAIGELGL